MIHYHGTPITPRVRLLELTGRNFCVSYADPRDVDVCHEIGQSVMLDNGAFTIWRQGKTPDWEGYIDWARPWLDFQTTWAVLPDVIDGSEADNDHLMVWLFAKAPDLWRRFAPVWHMNESIGRLCRLCHSHDRVCIGSSGEFAVVGDERWHRRMEQAMNAVCPNGSPPTWLHMLRGMSLSGSRYPFASVDSTMIAQNHAGNNTRGTAPKDVRLMADRLDGKQCAPRWRVTHEALTFEFGGTR